MDLHDREVRAAGARGLARRLGDEGRESIALTFVDNAGVTRVKAIPVSGLERAAAWGVGMSPVFDTFLVDDSITMGKAVGGPTGDLRLHPDVDALTPLSAQPGWAWAPVDRFEQDGSPYEGCQRLFAWRMAERAAAAGLEVRMGFEIEWVVATGAPFGRESGADEFTPACSGPAYGMTRVIELSEYCREIFAALAAESIPVEQVHPEYAPGQFEVSTAPTDPVAAADTNVLIRQTIRGVSEQYGYRVSFAPSVVAGLVGNGAHLHLSLYRDGRNLFACGPGRYGMSEEGESFLAAVLADLPALCAIGAPSVSSYVRLVPSHWAGVFQAWGRENREAAVRFITGPDGIEERSANAEIKCFDASANPYLVVGSVLAVGLAGIDNGRALPEETTDDPARHSAEELAGLGVVRLPQSSSEALAHLERHSGLREAMGEKLYDGFTSVRRGENELFEGWEPDAVVAATRLRY